MPEISARPRTPHRRHRNPVAAQPAAKTLRGQATANTTGTGRPPEHRSQPIAPNIAPPRPDASLITAPHPSRELPGRPRTVLDRTFAARLATAALARVRELRSADAVKYARMAAIPSALAP
jgi:hypothetical protein